LNLVLFLIKTVSVYTHIASATPADKTMSQPNADVDGKLGIVHFTSDKYGIVDAHPIVQAIRTRFAVKGIEFTTETPRFQDPVRASWRDNTTLGDAWVMNKELQELGAERIFINTFAPHPACFYSLFAHFHYVNKREHLHVEVWRWEKAADQLFEQN
jgi:hypothetical protein